MSIETNNGVYEFSIIPSSEMFYSDESGFGVYRFVTYDKIPHVQEVNTPFGDKSSQGFMGTIAGLTGKLEYGVKYNINAEIQYNDRYKSYQYKPTEVFPIKPSNLEDSRTFLLSCGISTNQVNSLLEKHPTVIDKVINEEDVDLKDVKGIKEKSFEKIKDKILVSYGSMELTLFLSPYGVSAKAIQSLFESGTNAKFIKSKIQENPYIITKIKGFGFKRADGIALKIKPEMISSLERTEAFVRFYLSDQASSNGHTWVGSEQFLAACRENIPECKDYIFQIIREGNRWLYVDKENKRLALQYYRDLEENIAKEILRIRDAQPNLDVLEELSLEQKIKQIEEGQGFEFTDEQRDVIHKVYQGNIVAVTGGAGCVDGDTEYFNGSEWVKIKDYREGDMVMQFNNKSREATLVEPIRYIKEKEDTLYRMKNFSGSIDQVLSTDHNFAYITSKSHIITKKFSEVMENHKNHPLGCGYKILNAFDYSGDGIDLSDDWIRLMVAVFADGSYYSQVQEYNDSYLTCRFHLKKERKKERLRELIKNVGISHREKESATEGYTDIYIKTPFRAKQFPKSWYQVNKQQLEIIFEEMFYWDGNFGQKGRRSFSTTIKADADFVQFVASSLGYTANIGTYDRRGQSRGKYIRKSIEYQVTVSIQKWRYVSMRTKEAGTKQEIEKYTEHDGYKYCFTVPTGYLVLRRSNKIFITGNCGKTSVVNGILKTTNTESERIAQVALAGKAALRIQDINGFPASTIHRLLKFEMGEFVYNKHNKLDKDYIVLDEASMIGAELFYSLLQAIPSGARVVIMGDVGQLDSIGVGSVFKDLLSSKTIPVVNLTKIHRQAQKSAIITESIKVSKGTSIVPSNFAGTKILGELQDLVLDISHDKEDTTDMIITRLKEELQYEGINEIQIIVPMKERGSACTYRLNNKIQQIVNPKQLNKTEVILKANTNYSYVIRKGDKVINTVNQYKTEDLSGDVCPVFNGNLGTVVSIYEKEMIIDFVGIGEVVVPKDKWKAIELGYAITTHKSQGSQWNKVIVGMDMSSYMLLSKEMLYTAITRASKKCYLCGENSSIKQACSTSKVLLKNTFLKEILKEV